ncbi:MAG: GNAT family N-acetyltransferase [Thiofilum sp.]|uniref:GNAT family N-acetyltransferase n=1 Tax=Thiofilum sp. TaxID=2212733 RepID=UPI0025D441CE|nr:GNAT family N-acetyltransferase [Thiofilum sp.]MBK8454475.1 GNAT family N-acetyltransferase [Thiofilum sp.]
MSTSYQLRLAHADDLVAIATLHAASWRATYPFDLSADYLAQDLAADRQALWQQRLTQPVTNQRVWVIDIAGSIVGFVCIYLQQDPQWGSLLDNLHVRSSAQGQGWSSILLQAVWSTCVTHAANNGLYLWVLQSNHKAQQIYQHYGAQRAEAGEWQAPDGSMVATWRYIWDKTTLAKLAKTSREYE